MFFRCPCDASSDSRQCAVPTARILVESPCNQHCTLRAVRLCQPWPHTMAGSLERPDNAANGVNIRLQHATCLISRRPAAMRCGPQVDRSGAKSFETTHLAPSDVPTLKRPPQLRAVGAPAMAKSRRDRQWPTRAAMDIIRVVAASVEWSSLQGGLWLASSRHGMGE